MKARAVSRLAVCQRRWCGTPLELWFDQYGQTHHECRPCARNARGLCRDCPKKLPPKKPNGPIAMRCSDCSVKHLRSVYAKRKKARYQTDRLTRLRILRANRKWRKANPTVPTAERRERHRKTSKVWRARHREDYNAGRRAYNAANRERVNERRRELRQENLERFRKRARDRYQREKEQIVARVRRPAWRVAA